MSKSMAIEGIMKIFLMVAVIIVGMSFLMKAFGIDIIGWLKDKFGGFDIVDEGIALHVKFDPGEDEIFEFHLTNGGKEGKYKATVDDSAKYHISETDEGLVFGLEKGPADGCLILTTDEWDSGVDAGRTYVVRSGTTVQSPKDKCNSLLECIGTSNIVGRHCDRIVCIHPDPGHAADPDCTDNRCIKVGECLVSVINQDGTSESKCEGGLKESGQFCFDYKNYVRLGTLPRGDIDTICDEEEEVLKQKFSDIKEWIEGCKDHSEGKRNKQCELLKQENVFTIDFGLVCDGNKWKACTPKKAEKVESAQGKTCQSDGDYWVWGGVSGQSGSANQPPKNVLLTASPTVQTVGQNVVLTMSAQDDDNNLVGIFVNLDDPHEDSNNNKQGKCNFLLSDDRSSTRTCSGGVCENGWTIVCTQPGTYKFQGQALDTKTFTASNVLSVEYNQ